MLKSTIFFFAMIAMFGTEGVESALSLINQGKADEAIAIIRPELDANPDNARAHELLSLAYLKQNKLDLAETEAKTALKLKSGDCSTHLTMARVATARQNWSVAEREIAQAEKVDADNSEIALHKGSLKLARKDYKGAVDLLDPFVKNNPDEPYGHYYLGLAQYGLRRPDKTVVHFQRFLALAPDAPEAARVESLLRSIR